MRILFEHQGILPVKKYGGTERILFWLMKELDRRGHEVFLIGHPATDLSGTTIRHIPNLQKDFRQLIPRQIDVAHFFYTPPWPLDVPYMVTIEGNGRPGETFPVNTVFISRDHAQRHGAKHFVYNGIDLEEYPLPAMSPREAAGSWNQFLFLAKASWKVKNLAACIEACKLSRKHLHIAGGRSFQLSRYIHSYGMVDQKEKRTLLAKTDALLFPVRWPEPFGIAIIEAFAQGRPVIGTPYGSLPELIRPHAGVLVKDLSELVAVLKDRPVAFNRDEIRDYVAGHFSAAKMAQDYLRLYERVAKGESLHVIPPHYLSSERAETLLPF